MLMQINIEGRSAFLPMDRYEAEQFLYDLGLDGPGAEHPMEMLYNFSDIQFEAGSDFRALNRLAWHICELGDQRDTFSAWRHAQESYTVEDALKAACNMRLICFYPGFDNDELLGEHALDNCVFEEYNELSDDAYAVLDRAKVGARFREQDSGCFVDGGYLAVDEDFAAAELPAEEPLARFQVWFSNGGMDTGWIDIPLSEADERFVSRCFGGEGLENLHMEYRSSLPQLNGLRHGMDELKAYYDIDDQYELSLYDLLRGRAELADVWIDFDSEKISLEIRPEFLHGMTIFLHGMTMAMQ